MKNYHLPLWTVLLLSLFACQPEQAIESPGQYLPLTIFEIPANQDTLLIGPGGVRLHIPTTQWEDENGDAVDGPIHIHLKEALALKDMLIGELSTMTDSGLLESDGMFYWEALDGAGNTLLPSEAIRFEVPIKTFVPKANLYVAEINKRGKLRWKKEKVLDDGLSKEQLIQGEALFTNLCRACHKIDKAVTGPALAGSTLRFEKKWLYEFTRDPIKMINEGDSIALSLLSRWGTLMQPYPDLADQEIKAIYDFIDYKSKFLPRKRLKEIHEENSITPADHFYLYSSGLQFPGWFSISQKDIDKLVDQDYQVNLSLSKPERPSVALVFPGKTFIYRGRINPEGNFFFSNEFESRKSLLPRNQKVLLVATASQNGRTYFGIQESIVKDGITEKIKMEALPREEIWERLESIF